MFLAKMHFQIIVASIITLCMGATAAPASNTRLAQIRLYGEPGCYRQNMGELGIYDANECRSFGNWVVRSVRFETNHVGCSCMLNLFRSSGEGSANVLAVHVYSDSACQFDERVPGLSECLSGDGQYQSYVLRCNR